MALIFNEPDVTWMHLPFYIKLMSATEYPRLVDSTSADIGAFNHITTGSITFRHRDILVLRRFGAAVSAPRDAVALEI